MKLIDVYPIVNGFFTVLSKKNPGLEWLSKNAELLDLRYVTSKSGLKETSPLIDYLMENSINTQLSPTDLGTLADMSIQYYGESWKRLYELTKTQYKPLENYAMTETETPDITETDTKTSKSTETPNLTRTTETKKATDLSVTGTGKSDGGYAGFNSANTNKQTSTDATSTEKTVGDLEKNKETGTESETGTRITDESVTNQHKQSGTRNLTRSGNIGVTTSQQMAQSEIELWKWHFIESVFNDIDELFTIPKYNY